MKKPQAKANPSKKPAAQPDVKKEEVQKPAMHFSGWFSQSVCDNAIGPSIVVKADPESEDEDDSRAREEAKRAKNNNRNRRNPKDSGLPETKNSKQSTEEHAKTGQATTEPKSGEEEAKGEEEKKEVAKVINRPFDPEKDAKSWDSIDLGSMMMQGNKKRGVVQDQ